MNIPGNTMSIILVQISDHQWTTRAVHMACAMAYTTHSSVVLLHMIQVQTPYLLGANLGAQPPAINELAAINTYRHIAADYGVEMVLRRMEYNTLSDALVQAAECINPSLLFAHLPQNPIPFWRKLERWNLCRHLKAQQCQLETLDEPTTAEHSAPSVTLRPTERHWHFRKPAHI